MDSLTRPAVSVALIVSLIVGSMVLLLIQPAYALTTVTVPVGGTTTVTPGAGETFSEPEAGDTTIVGVSITGRNLTITCKGNGATLVRYTVKKGATQETRVILVLQGTATVKDDGVVAIPPNKPMKNPGSFKEGAVSGDGGYGDPPRTNKKGEKKTDVTVRGKGVVYILYTDATGGLHLVCYTAIAQAEGTSDDRQEPGGGGGDY